MKLLLVSVITSSKEGNKHPVAGPSLADEWGHASLCHVLLGCRGPSLPIVLGFMFLTPIPALYLHARTSKLWLFIITS